MLADSLGRTPLHAAAAANQAGSIKILAIASASIQQGDASGKPPLHTACAAGAVAAAQALLQLGAAPSQQDGKGNTALHWCACSPAPEALLDLPGMSTDSKLLNQTNL